MSHGPLPTTRSSLIEEAAVAAVRRHGQTKIVKEVEAALLAAQPKVVRDTYRPTEGDWQPKV